MNRRKFALGIGGVSALALPTWAAGTNSSFQMVSIVLYLPDQAMWERGPTVEALAAYVKGLVSRANETLAAQPPRPGVSGAVVMGLKPPSQSRMWLVLGDNKRQGELASILQAPLESVPAPSVSGLNAFAINFDAWGGGERLPSQIPVPDEWARVMNSPGILPDAPMRKLWPN